MHISCMPTCLMVEFVPFFMTDKPVCYHFCIGRLSHFMPEPTFSVNSGIQFAGSGLSLHYAIVECQLLAV